MSGKYLVVGEGLHLTNDARVFCLDVEQSEKQRRGVKLWEFRTNSHVESSPSIADGKVYIGAGDDGFYCFDLEPDKEGNPQVLWHLPGNEYPDCETSPVVYNGKVYFGLGIGGNALVCVDANSGDLVWRIDTPYPVFSSPAISEGKLYVGMGHGDFVNTAEQVAANMRARMSSEGRSDQEITSALASIEPAGELWCVDIASGDVDWQYKVQRTILGAPAVDADRIYFASRDGNLYCISTDGSLLAKFDAKAPIITSPAVGDQFVCFYSQAGQLFCLEKYQLAVQFNTSVDSPSFSSPVMARGHVYIGTTEKGLLCIGKPLTLQVKPVWPGYLGTADNEMGRNNELSQHAAYAWGFLPIPDNENQKPDQSTIRSPAALINNEMFIGVNWQQTCGLAAIKSAESLNRKPTLKWFVNTNNPVVLSPAATEQAVYFVDGSSSQKKRMLQCVDIVDGGSIWQHTLGDNASGKFTITNDQLFIVDTDKTITCFDIRSPDNITQTWQAQIGPALGSPFITDDIILLAVKSPAQVVALDTSTGLLLWTQTLTAIPTTNPVYASNRVWIGYADQITGFSLVNGYQNYTVKNVTADSKMVTNGTYVTLAAKSGEIIVIDADTGKENARIPDAVTEFPPLLIGNSLLYYTDRSIQRYDINTAANIQWTPLRVSWPGKPTSPMIMVDSHLLFATDQRSLICMKPKKR